MTPLLLMSLTNMITGTMITMSSSTWISAWMGLELNTMGFLPLMLSNQQNSKEATMKYFIIQSLSSSILVMSSTTSPLMATQSLTSDIIFITLSLKMALAPMHSWLPKISEMLKWPTILILFTWQKIPPLISMMQISSNLMIPMMILSSTIGATMMMNQTSTKKIMAYSSITHLSWIILSTITNKYLIMTNFAIYLSSLTPTIAMMSMLNVNSINHTTHLNKKTKSLLLLTLLTMSGFPPTSSFLQKMTVISIIPPSLVPITIMILITSTLTLFVYTQITFIPMSMSPITTQTTKHHKTFPFLMTPIILMIIVSLSPLPFLLFMPN